MKITRPIFWRQLNMPLSRRYVSLRKATTSSSRRTMASSTWYRLLLQSTWIFSTKLILKINHISLIPVLKIKMLYRMINTLVSHNHNLTEGLIMSHQSRDSKRSGEITRSRPWTQTNGAKSLHVLITKIYKNLLYSTKNLLQDPIELPKHITKIKKILRNGQILIAH